MQIYFKDSNTRNYLFYTKLLSNKAVQFIFRDDNNNNNNNVLEESVWSREHYWFFTINIDDKWQNIFKMEHVLFLLISIIFNIWSQSYHSSDIFVNVSWQFGINTF